MTWRSWRPELRSSPRGGGGPSVPWALGVGPELQAMLAW